MPRRRGASRPPKTPLAKFLRETRERTRLNQTEWGKLTAATQSQVSRYEAGDDKPPFDYVARTVHAARLNGVRAYLADAPVENATGQSVVQTGQHLADEKKHEDVTTPVTRAVVKGGSSDSAVPSRAGGAPNVEGSASADPSRQSPPIDQKIIGRFTHHIGHLDELATLLRQIVNAYGRGEIRSTRSPRPTGASRAPRNPRQHARRPGRDR